MTHRTAAPARPAWATLSLRAKKVLAFVVIVGCLGAQAFVSVRPSEARLWPFVSYPMYARSHSPGDTIRLRQLRSRECPASATPRKVEPRTLGYQPDPYGRELAAIARGRPAARRYRAALSRRAVTHVLPRPCALQLWERVITLPRDGVSPAALSASRWRPVLEWRVDDSDAVRVLTP